MKNDIFELHQVSAWGERHPRRRAHLERVGMFDSFENAEGSMRLFIQDEKLKYGEWDKDYHKECLSYLINSQKILHCELPPSNCHPQWWSYNAKGEVNDCSLANVHGYFYGRTTNKIRFQVGDIMEYLWGVYVELGIVGMLSPTPERYEELRQRSKQMYDDRPFNLDESDDCYLIYTLGEGDTH